jgi:hypothetical protein
MLAFFVGAGGFVACLYAFPVPLHEFDASWYQTHRGVSEALGRHFRADHRWTVIRAQADHFVHPIGPGRVIGLLAASSADDSGDVLLYFGSAFASGDAGLHLLPVYCWSDRQQRLVWKGLQDNSP